MVTTTPSCLSWCFCSTAERASCSNLLDFALIPMVLLVKAISSLRNNVIYSFIMSYSHLPELRQSSHNVLKLQILLVVKTASACNWTNQMLGPSAALPMDGYISVRNYFTAHSSIWLVQGFVWLYSYPVWMFVSVVLSHIQQLENRRVEVNEVATVSIQSKKKKKASVFSPQKLNCVVTTFEILMFFSSDKTKTERVCQRGFLL